MKYILAIAIEKISFNEVTIIFLKKFHRHLLPRLPFLTGYQFTKLLLLSKHWMEIMTIDGGEAELVTLPSLVIRR